MQLAKRLARLFLLLVIVLICVTGAAGAATQTPWFRNWLRQYVTTEANAFLNGRLEIGRLTGNLFHGVTLENVTLTMADEQILSISSFRLEYNALHIISRGLSIDRMVVDRPQLVLKHDASGWSLSGLIKSEAGEADRGGPARPFGVDAVEIRGGSIVIDDTAPPEGVRLPKRLDDLEGRLVFAYEPVHYSLEVSSLAFSAADPSLVVADLSGGVAVRDDTVFLDNVALRTAESSVNLDGAIQDYLGQPRFNLKARSHGTSLSEIGRIVPSIERNIAPSFDVAVEGPLEQLSIVAQAQSGKTSVRSRMTVDASGPEQSIKGEVTLAHLDLALITNDPAKTSDINANVTANLKTPSLTDRHGYSGKAALDATASQAMGYRLDAARLDADIDGRSALVRARAAGYAASITADGKVTSASDDTRVQYDLQGAIEHVNVRRLPVALPGLPSSPQTAIGGRYHATGSEPITAASGADTRTVSLQMTFAESTVPGATIVAGSDASVRINGSRTTYETNAELSQVNLQALGEAFGVEALSESRYQSTIDGRVSLRGEGSSLDELSLTANGSVFEASLLGGRLADMTFDGSVEHRAATITASGSITDFDPAVLAEREDLRGRLGGRFDVHATVEDVGAISTPAGPEGIDASVQLAVDPSTVGRLSIERGDLDASYRDNTADVRRLELTGPGLNVSGSGSLALGNEGSSDFFVKGSALNLETLGQLADVPVSGLAQLDLHVTGNRTALRTRGTITGSEVKYGENGVLSMTSTIDATVPDLTIEHGTIGADTQATFVTLAGQEINKVTAKTTYRDRQLEFDATAAQPERSAQLTGALVLHPDHQEIHLTRLDLTSSGQTWSVPDGDSATINYADEAIAVDGLRLASGDQMLEIDGRFGRPGEALSISATHVELASVDAILLRPPQFSGRLDASATISGTRAAPEARADFQVANGGFQKFRYDSFSGSIELADSSVTVDARLQQNPTQWLTAKGSVPVSAFSRQPEGEETTAHVEPAPGTPQIDLAIDSTPIDLGVINGLTTAVTNVTGSMEVHVKVTGAPDDPHPTGGITLAGGSFNVPATGVNYDHIAGQVDLQPDRVHISQLTVLDNHQSALSLTGDLAVHARDIGGVRIWLNGEDFKIVDNKLGNLRIQTAIELGGELTAPQVRGFLGVTTGRVNIDEILAAAGVTSAYSTEAVSEEAESAPPETAPSPWEALDLDVSLTIPDDLVLRAVDLQAPSGSVGLGSLNVTLGGTLNATKKPAGALQLVGDIQTIRGTYDFQSRRFEIVRGGTIRFEGQPELNPALDLRMRREIQGVEARINLGGYLREPKLTLSSTPPLEEADILSLIVFNQPINELGQGQQASLAARAQSLATGAVAGQLAQSIGNALNLDTFEIAVGPDSGSAAEVTLGQQLGRNLFFKLVQGVGDASSTNVIIEYEFLKWLRLQSNMLQGAGPQQSLFRRAQGSGADLIFLFTK